MTSLDSYPVDIPTRLKLILRAFDYCGQEPTFTEVAKQFRYETQRSLSREDYEHAIKKGR